MKDAFGEGGGGLSECFSAVLPTHMGYMVRVQFPVVPYYIICAFRIS